MDLPKHNHTSARSRKGVNFLSEYAADYQQIWRETSDADVGIDGQMEYVHIDENGQGFATGRLLAFQVKTGDSYFKHETEEGWKYYVRPKELNYWKNFPIPVILFLFNDKTGDGYFVDVRQTLRAQLQNSNVVVVSKENAIKNTNPKELFMNCGITEKDYDFNGMDDVVRFMQTNRVHNFDCTLSFFELFSLGIVCQGRSLFFGIDLVMQLTQYYIDKNVNKFPELDVAPTVNHSGDVLITKYLEFLVGFNLIYFDPSLIYMDLNEDSVYPAFVAKLTEKGVLLNRYIKEKYDSLLGYPLSIEVSRLNPNFHFKLSMLDRVMSQTES